MRISAFVLVGFASLLTACFPITQPIIPPIIDPEIQEMLSYKKGVSPMCSGESYRSALGKEISIGASIKADLTNILINPGAGKGDGSFDLNVKERTELSKLLGTLTNDQLERFLSNFYSCLDKQMIDYREIKKNKTKHDDTEWITEENGHSYTTGRAWKDGADNRETKMLKCPLGKEVIPGSAVCFSTVQLKPKWEGVLPGNNIYKCVWDTQPEGIGLGIRMACRTPSN